MKSIGTAAAAIAAVIVLALTGLLAPTATADEPVTGRAAPGAVDEARGFLDLFGVEPGWQDGLLDDLAAGKAWDSMNPGAEPVSRDVRTARGVNWNVARFE